MAYSKKGATGTVIWFSDEKGFGFIETYIENTRVEIFTHFAFILSPSKTLFPGEQVLFDIEQNDNNGRLIAVNVAVLNYTDLCDPRRKKIPEDNGNTKEKSKSSKASVVVVIGLLLMLGLLYYYFFVMN